MANPTGKNQYTATGKVSMSAARRLNKTRKKSAQYNDALHQAAVKRMMMKGKK